MNRFLVWPQVLCVVILAVSAWPQQASNSGHVGRVRDWTSSHIMVSGGLTPANLRLAEMEPRIRFRLTERFRPENVQLSGGYNSDNNGPNQDLVPPPSGTVVDGMSSQNTASRKIDWSVPLGAGNVAPNNFPAKFSFDINANPDCVNDYVVFALNVAGVTQGQANLVGINQLYSGSNPTGICGTAPNINWSYNGSTANGKVLTSVVLSLDGSKIAYVESASGSSVFHVLSWKAGEGTSVTAAASPTPVGSCTVSTSCLASVTYSTTHTATLASPWVDYQTDKGFLASDDGKIYRISCVFKCPLNANPTVDWSFKLPVAGTGGALPKPNGGVYNYPYGYLIVGDQLGEIWTINAGGSTPSVAFGPVMVGGGGCTIANPPGRTGTPAPCTANGKSYGIPDSIELDSSGGSERIYAYSGNDGTPGASAVVVQMSQTLTLASQVRVHVGLGSVANTTTHVDLHSGDFDNAYFYGTPSSGHLFLCGTGTNDTTPYRYWIGFSAYPVMDANPTQGVQQTATPGIPCTPYSEFYNPNIKLRGLTNDHDLLMSGLVGSGTNGNVISDDISSVPSVGIMFVPYPGGTSAIVFDDVSSQPQASSLYFSTLGVVTQVGTCINSRCAVKLSQLSLQ
jgi:hypothetical protein